MEEEPNDNGTKIIETDKGAIDGQNKCPKCGSTDISVNARTGKLRCNFCRHEFEPEKLQGMETDISKLEGRVMASGTQDIVDDAQQNVVTLKCTSCGAEVVIDTAEATQARCHWCRNTLSINQQVPNGVIPDVVLPFNVTKAEAEEQIQKFVRKRKFYSHPKFRREFSTQNIMGVYFPYMLIDINTHAYFSGHGEREVRRYRRSTRENGNYSTYYDADLYEVERDFDLTIEGLTVESSADKLKRSSDNTNNVINSIMPFDTENSAKYNANYLKGYTAEKRDVNVEQLEELVDRQSKDIARYAAKDTIKEYDRGVSWSKEQLSVKGEQWKTAYLPVWLYSYQEKKYNNSILHYVAVNARTKETMGSVPINIPKLFLVSCIIEILAIIASIKIDFDYSWILWLVGILYFVVMRLRYRNSNERHYYEKETKRTIFNLKKADRFIKKETELSDSKISNENSERITGQNIQENILNKMNDLIK